VKRGAPKIRLHAEYDTDEFRAEYQTAIASGAAIKRKPRASKGTLEWA
jgi:hypothetical protein